MSFPSFSVGEVLTANDMNAVGLWLVSSTTITSASTHTVSNCFSSNYRNYRLIANWTQNTSAGTVYLRFRDSSGQINTNYGFSVGGTYYSSGVNQYNNFNSSTNLTQAQIETTGATAGNRAQFIIDVIGPNLSQETYLWMNLVSPTWSATLTRVAVSGYAVHNAATVCTGLDLVASAGTFTGSLQIYGYKN